MNLNLSTPHDDWSQFPRADIPILPVIDFSHFHNTSNNSINFYSPFIQEKAFTVYSPGARYSLALALKILNIGSHCSVLMPSYHCLSMIAPVVRSGADIQFYKLNEDLSFDIEDIERKISPKTKAILVVHFFGFPQQLSNLIVLCRKHNIQLIEDCAHVFFTISGIDKVGEMGDFAVASLKKFFPVTDGGMLLINNNGTQKPKQTSLKCKGQIKHLVNLFEQSIDYQDSEMIKTVYKLFHNIKAARKNMSEEGLIDIVQELSDIKKIKSWLDPALKEKKISKISKLIVKHSKKDKICTTRKSNYFHFLEKFNKSKSVVPLFSNLPKDVVPYMFPLILNNPDTDFKKLKMKKIPIWRWEELCISDCEISQYFSKHLIQLPCHQSLKPHQMQIIVDAVNGL